MMSFIEVHGLHRVYNSNTPEQVNALKGIDLAIDRGEMLAVMGPSGSGKSILLNILGCLDYPKEGKYYFDGQLVSTLKQNKLAQIRNKRVGFVLQDFGILNDRTAIENVITSLLFNQAVKWRDMEKLAHNIMEKLEISELAKRRTSNLSGGEKQRVAIARAMVNEPDIILADEPTGSLDTRLSNEILTLLQRLNEEGKTVIIVSHNPNVSKYCNRTLNIVDGRLCS
jgi:putative ABC transport system ATP-binding protein